MGGAAEGSSSVVRTTHVGSGEQSGMRARHAPGRQQQRALRCTQGVPATREWCHHHSVLQLHSAQLQRLKQRLSAGGFRGLMQLCGSRLHLTAGQHRAPPDGGTGLAAAGGLQQGPDSAAARPLADHLARSLHCCQFGARGET